MSATVTKSKPAATKKSTARRPFYEVIVDALKGGKNVPVKTLESLAKKNGISNFQNRFYWFRKNRAQRLGLKAVYDKEKQTLRIISADKAKAAAKSSK